MPRPLKCDGWSISEGYLDWSKGNLVLVKNPEKKDPKNLLYITKDEYNEYTEVGSGPVAAKNAPKEIGDTYVASYSRGSYKMAVSYMDATIVTLDFNRKELTYLNESDYNKLPTNIKAIYNDSDEEVKKILSDAKKMFPSVKGIWMTMDEFFNLLQNNKYPKLFPYRTYIKELMVNGDYKPEVSNYNASVDNTKKKIKSYRPVKFNAWSMSAGYLNWYKANLVIVKNPENKNSDNLLYITKEEYDKYVKTGLGPVAGNSSRREIGGGYVVYFSRNAAKVCDTYWDTLVVLDFEHSVINYLSDSKYKELPQKIRKIYKDSDDKNILSDVKKKFPIFNNGKGGIIMNIDEFYDLLNSRKYPKLFTYRSFVQELMINGEYNPRSSKSELPMNLSELFE